MASPDQLEMTLLPGARELLAVHARELPQRDDLCGAFCGALALRAAGIGDHDGAPLDQDEVALAAGSVVAGARAPGVLPQGEPGDATTGCRFRRSTIPTSPGRPPRACSARSPISAPARSSRSHTRVRGPLARSPACSTSAARASAR